MIIITYGIMPPEKCKDDSMNKKEKCPDCRSDLEEVRLESEMKELKTRSELMAEFEKDSEVIRKHFDEACVRVRIFDIERRNMMRIDLDDCSEGDICGNEFEYRPDPVAPADGRAVIVGNIGKIRVSRGTFSEYGKLQTYEDEDSIYSGDAGWINWCDYLNRDHHSPGWKKEWEPKQ